MIPRILTLAALAALASCSLAPAATDDWSYYKRGSDNKVHETIANGTPVTTDSSGHIKQALITSPTTPITIHNSSAPIDHADWRCVVGTDGKFQIVPLDGEGTPGPAAFALDQTGTMSAATLSGATLTTPTITDATFTNAPVLSGTGTLAGWQSVLNLLPLTGGTLTGGLTINSSSGLSSLGPVAVTAGGGAGYFSLAGQSGSTPTGTSGVTKLWFNSVAGIQALQYRDGTGSPATVGVSPGKSLTVNNTLAFAGTDGSTVNAGTGGTVSYQPILETGAWTAAIGASYKFTGTPNAAGSYDPVPVTDPSSPSDGDLYTVLIERGLVTIGGDTFGDSPVPYVRRYDAAAGAWQTLGQSVAGAAEGVNPSAGRDYPGLRRLRDKLYRQYQYRTAQSLDTNSTTIWTPTLIMWCMTGDSMSRFKADQMMPWLWRAYGCGGAITLAPDALTFDSAVSGDVVTHYGTDEPSKNYNYWITGEYADIGPGGSVSCQRAGTSQLPSGSWTKLFASFVDISGGGTCKIQVLDPSTGSWTDATPDGAGSTTISTDNGGAPAGHVVTITESYPANWDFRIVGLTGRVIQLHRGKLAPQRGGVVQIDFTRGGLNFPNYNTVSSAVLNPIFASLYPDIITYEGKEGTTIASDLATFTSKLNTACASSADWLFYGTPPDQGVSGHPWSTEQNRLMRLEVQALNTNSQSATGNCAIGYEYWDAYPAGQNYVTMQDLGWLPTVQTSTFTVSNGGSGYIAPTATMAAPDLPWGQRGTLAVTTSGGVVTGVHLTNNPSGYTTATPAVTISDSTGTGAVVTSSASVNGVHPIGPFNWLTSIILMRDLGLIPAYALPPQTVTGQGKNRVPNARFANWSSGTSISIPANAITNVADSWYVQTTAFYEGAATCSQQSQTPGDISPEGGAYYLRLARTTPTTTTAETLNVTCGDARTLADRTVMLSFWARSNVSGLMLSPINLIRGYGSGGSASDTFSHTFVPLGTTWQRYRLKYTLPPLGGKTIGTGSALIVQFGLPPGPNFQFDLYGVQLEEGEFATNLEPELPPTNSINTTSISLPMAIQGTTAATLFADHLLHANTLYQVGGRYDSAWDPTKGVMWWLGPTSNCGLTAYQNAPYKSVALTANMTTASSNYLAVDTSKRVAQLSLGVDDNTAMLNLLVAPAGSGARSFTSEWSVDLSGNSTQLGGITTSGDLVLSGSGKVIRPGGSSGPVWRTGAGAPEGAVTAPVGSLYTRTDGGTSTTLYVKESGSGNTGWIAK